MAKASNNPFPSILLVEQGSAPAAPASGQGRLYLKADGVYFVDDAGTETGPFGVAGGGSGDPEDGWLAAGETWTYASADDPTFTFTISGDKTSKYSPGMRLKLTQTTVKYFIITKVEHSGGTTTITAYGGTDYDLANAAISNPYFSTQKAPHGFPLDPSKWAHRYTDSGTIRTQASPTVNVWYNLNSASLVVPIGCWRLRFQVAVQVTDGGVIATLSTANNSQTDLELTAAGVSGYQANRDKTVLLTSKTTYYLNSMTPSAPANLWNRADLATTTIEAICAYL